MKKIAKFWVKLIYRFEPLSSKSQTYELAHTHTHRILFSLIRDAAHCVMKICFALKKLVKIYNCSKIAQYLNMWEKLQGYSISWENRIVVILRISYLLLNPSTLWERGKFSFPGSSIYTLIHLFSLQQCSVD